MKIKIITLLTGIGLLAAANLPAQRMPQDSWYLYKEFRGENNGGKFYNPHEAALGPDGNLYVADRYNHQVQVFNQDGAFLRKWGGSGNKPGKFNEPTGIHVTPNGKVYVCEAGSGRVQVFDAQGIFLQAMGQPGSAVGQLNYPHGVTVDNDGNVYVVEHSSSRVTVFGTNGAYLRSWGAGGSADGSFNAAIAICRTPDNKIAVLERDGDRRIQIFEPDGTFLRKFNFDMSGINYSWGGPHGIETDSAGNFYVTSRVWAGVSVYNPQGSRILLFGQNAWGSGDGQFNPFGLAVGNGKVFVCDWDNHRIAVFATNGTWIKNFGSFGPGELQNPHGVAVDAAGNIYINSHQDGEVAKFDKDYNFIKRFGSSGSGDGQFNGVLEMAVGPNNRLYVVDHSGHRVQIFDLEGNFVGKFGVNGSGDGQFQHPWGIAVSANRVYVADRDNHRIQLFDLDGNFIKKVGSNGSFGGQFSSPSDLALLPNGNLVVGDRGNGRLQIFDANGNYLKKFDWNPERIATSSDGLIYGSWWNNGLGFVDSIKLEVLKGGGFGGQRGPMAESINGDLISAGSDQVVRVWRRTFRTETPATHNAIPLPVVLGSSQRSGQKLLDVDYRVNDSDSATVQTAALAFRNGGNSLNDLIPIRHLTEGTGNQLGANITTGQSHRFTWDLAQDWSGNFDQVQIEVLAKDNRGLLNLDFIQMPAVGGDSAVRISRTPLNDADFLSVWYWLIATGDPEVRLENGLIKQVGDIRMLGLNGTYFADQYWNTTIRVETGQQYPGFWGEYWSTDFRSARWEGEFVPVKTGTYTFRFDVDDVVNIWIDGDQVVNENVPNSFTVSATANTPLTIRIDFADRGYYGLGFWLYMNPPGETERRVELSDFQCAGAPVLASGTSTTANGREFVLNRMGYREATGPEVLRAKYAGNPGSIVQWDPKLRVGPEERPWKVNQYNFETGVDGTWVVPK